MLCEISRCDACQLVFLSCRKRSCVRVNFHVTVESKLFGPDRSPPALEKRSADAQHACIRAVVRMVRILDHLLRTAVISGSERMVPGLKHETVWIRSRVLKYSKIRPFGQVRKVIVSLTAVISASSRWMQAQNSSRSDKRGTN